MTIIDFIYVWKLKGKVGSNNKLLYNSNKNSKLYNNNGINILIIRICIYTISTYTYKIINNIYRLTSRCRRIRKYFKTNKRQTPSDIILS